MRRVALAIMFIIVFVGMALANEKVSVAAFEYPPIYQNQADKGLSCEIVSAAFKAVNIDTDFQFYPVARMVLSVADGQALCGVGGAVLFEAPDTAAAVNVSTVVNYVTQVFVYDMRKYPSGIPFKSVDDVTKYSIGVLNSSGIMKFLERTKNINLMPNNSHDGSARQLQLGRIDIGVTCRSFSRRSWIPLESTVPNSKRDWP